MLNWDLWWTFRPSCQNWVGPFVHPVKIAWCFCPWDLLSQWLFCSLWHFSHILFNSSANPLIFCSVLHFSHIVANISAIPLIFCSVLHFSLILINITANPLIFCSSVTLQSHSHQYFSNPSDILLSVILWTDTLSPIFQRTLWYSAQCYTSVTLSPIFQRTLWYFARFGPWTCWPTRWSAPSTTTVARRPPAWERRSWQSVPTPRCLSRASARVSTSRMYSAAPSGNLWPHVSAMRSCSGLWLQLLHLVLIKT